MTSRETDEKQVDQSKARLQRRSRGDSLNGTTRRVYRYVYRRGPVRLHEIERELGFSSSSVADYHVQKLLKMGLIRDDSGANGSTGYVADRAIFEAMIRIRRTVIPLWTTATSFFAAGLVVLLTILRPASISSTYLFSLIIDVVALSICTYETIRSLGKEAL